MSDQRARHQFRETVFRVLDGFDFDGRSLVEVITELEATR